MKFNENGKERFLFLYQNDYTSLNDHQRGGMIELLNLIEADDELTDPRQVAYLLATIKHECGDTWLPIKEIGKGKGHKYGVPDPVTGHCYYGRGYCQLTWASNYKTMGIALGVDLYNEPDLALQPLVAYEIISRGMRKGSFTGASLKRYINDDQCDYRLARKIINGLDCAELIAGYALRIEAILKECAAPPEADHIPGGTS